MECNKEEALRAKVIAEKKMEIKDFTIARKIALKAQQLYPSLENISQMLTVCDVHISAELNMSGSELDWYGILQVEQSADEASIKKQYRKLALQLHPDKNKFAGAESAFKLIGEAHRVLTDQAKRYLYDIKRRASTRTNRQVPPQQNRNSHARKQTASQSSFMNHASSQFPGSNQPHQQQSQTPPTFWTVCPFCGIKYQYYRTVLERALRCQNCSKPFIGYDMDAQGPLGANSGSAVNQSAAPGVGQTAGQQSGTGFEGNGSGGAPASKPFLRTGTGVPGGGSQGKVAADGNSEHRAKTSQNVSRKRERKMEMGSSDSCDTDSTDIEIEPMEEDVGINSSRYPRRSGRQKQNVACGENGSKKDDLEKRPSSKRSKGRGESGNTNSRSNEAFSKGDAEAEKEGQEASMSSEENLPNGEEQTASASSEARSEPENIDYPEPEFHDFDKEKEINCFAVDQIWATYDDSGGMPRFYARIRKVYTTESKLRITWLEANPKDQGGRDWVEEELPYACGNFKTGATEDAEHAIFSHLASWEKGVSRSTYNIYPRKGDIWALFKGWDIGWSADPESHRHYEFEIVEVLSDYSEQVGVEVTYLVKLKGFTSLFQPASSKEMDSFQILPNEILRFSHRIPHYRMTGEERNDVPTGSFELDPASVPHGMEEVTPSKISDHIAVDNDGLETEVKYSGSKSAEENDNPATGHEKCKKPEESIKVTEKNSMQNENLDCRRSPRKINRCYEKKVNQTSHHAAETGKHLNVAMGNPDGFPDKRPGEANSTKSLGDEKENHLHAEKATAVDADENHSGNPSSPVECEYPDAEFHVFGADRSEDKFRVGQIWALYSKEHDGMPKYYAKIKKVESEVFEVHVIWLEACPLPMEEVDVQWSKKDLPITLGRFKLGENATFDSTQAFSHLVQAEYLSKWRKYVIYPKKGEVWLLYKNWSAEWTQSSVKNCKYDVVEVLENSGSVFEVLVLKMVDGFKTVFKGHGSTMIIEQHERLRFSHRVPAIMLTDEGGGKLRGCWELDPDAMPTNVFSAISS